MLQVFLDIETTGFSREWNEIIEIAAALYDTDKGYAIDSFHAYIHPQRGVPKPITELTGIDNLKLANCKPEWEVLGDLYDWLSDYKPQVVIGHNIKSFDLNFIAARCNRFSIPNAFEGLEIIDTLTMARQMMKAGTINVPNCKQPTLAAFYNIEYNAHSALADVGALVKIYQKMIGSDKPTRASLGF